MDAARARQIVETWAIRLEPAPGLDSGQEGRVRRVLEGLPEPLAFIIVLKFLLLLANERLFVIELDEGGGASYSAVPVETVKMSVTVIPHERADTLQWHLNFDGRELAFHDGHSDQAGQPKSEAKEAVEFGDAMAVALGWVPEASASP